MKRVMHILNTNSYSGAENVVITIINAMKLKYDYELIYVSPNGPISEILKKNNIKFVPIKKVSVKEIRRVVKEYKPDIIHAHDFTASVICAFSGLRVKIISHLHNNSPWLKTFHPYSFAYLISSLRFQKILMVSKSVIDEYVFGKLIYKKSIIVDNPIDISIVQNKIKNMDRHVEKYDIVFIGRLSKAKDPIRFIEIVSELTKILPDIKVAMIGTGEMFEECLKSIEERKLNSTINMLGFMENPYYILSQSKCLCLTSKWEGYGLVVVEALSLGIPVVATSVGGVPNILNNDCGMLCNTDTDFTDEISNLLKNENYFKQKSIEALIRSQELDNIEIYTEKLNKIYLA